MRTWTGAPVFAFIMLSCGSASAGPITQDACPGAAVPEPFVTIDPWLENLHFYDGTLLTASRDGVLRAHDAEGDTREVTALGASSGAMVTAPGGALYVRVGEGVQRMASLDAEPEVVAEELAGANGMAIDRGGNVYVSGDSAGVIYRIAANDTTASKVWAHVYSANGLAVDDERRILFAAQTTDGRSTIAAIALDDPTNVTTVASLSFGAAQLDLFGTPPLARPVEPSDPSDPVIPKGIDDLTLGADGFLYVAAWVTGEILRVDPSNGDACVLASGLRQPTSVRIAHGFGDHDGHLFVTEAGSAADLVLDTPATPARVSVIPVRIAPPAGSETSDALSLGRSDAADAGSNVSALGTMAGLLLLAVAAFARRSRR